MESIRPFFFSYITLVSKNVASQLGRIRKAKSCVTILRASLEKKKAMLQKAQPPNTNMTMEKKHSVSHWKWGWIAMLVSWICLRWCFLPIWENAFSKHRGEANPSMFPPTTLREMIQVDLIQVLQVNQGSLDYPFWKYQTIQMFQMLVILRDFPCNSALFGLVIYWPMQIQVKV